MTLSSELNMSHESGAKLVDDFLATGGFTVATAERPLQQATEEQLQDSLAVVQQRLHTSRRRQIARLVRLKQLIERELGSHNRSGPRAL